MAPVVKAARVIQETGQNLNPLEIPLILEHVFGFLPPKDLAACRQVCKLWSAHSLRMWRSTATVLLAPGSQGSKLPSFMKIAGRKDYKNLGKPFTNFAITRHANIPRFWNLCGSQITILKLFHVSFRSVEDLRNVLFKCCPNLQQLALIKLHAGISSIPKPIETVKAPENRNLKKLTLDVRAESMRITWTELLSQFPDITVLTLQGAGVDYVSLFQTIQSIRKADPSKLNLIEFHLLCKQRCRPFSHYNSYQNLLEFLFSSHFRRLEQLSLRISVEGGTPNIWELIGARASTLTKLDLGRYSVVVPRGIAFSHYLAHNPTEVYENLEEITLHTRVFTSLEFLRFTANLKKLKIAGYQDCNQVNIIGATKTSAMAGVQLKGVAALEIDKAAGMSAEEMTKLVAWLPNVKKLKMSEVNNCLFAIVCTSWPELEELRITDCHVDECGFTGFCRATVDKLNRGKKLKDSEVGYRSGNITSMPRLRRLSLDRKDCSSVSSIKLGLCVATHAFQRLVGLHHLQILGYELRPKKKWEGLLRNQYPWV